MAETEGNFNDTIAQVVGIVTKRRWWILAAAVCVPLATIAVVLRLPDQYTSEALLVNVQQQISQKYVDPANTTSTADVVGAMEREILSRTRLLGVIEALGLYPQEKAGLSSEALVGLMRKSISIEPVDLYAGRSDFSAFKVSFTAGNPELAQQVTNKLTTLFIEEHMKAREGQAATTTKFLTEQLEVAKQKLDEQEQRLRDFKMNNLGQLPEQEQANLGTLTDLRIQLQTTMANSTRVQQQRISLESLLSGSVARLQSERGTLLTRFTARHPEVLKKEQEVAKAESLLNQLKTGQPDVQKAQSPATLDDPVIAQLKGQIEANLAESESLSRDQQRLRGEVARYQNRLQLTPVREQQLGGILRDSDLYRKNYEDLKNSQLRSQLTTNVEESQGARHFRLVDSATLPEQPSKPKRLKMSLGGLAAGLVLGGALALLAHSRDSSFHAEKEARAYFGAPLVVGVPLLLTPTEESARGRRRVLEWAAAATMTLVVCAAEFYIYRHG